MLLRIHTPKFNRTEDFLPGEDLTGERAGVPTNAHLAAQLGYDTKVIERHLQSIYDALELGDLDQGRRRDAAVRSAIDRGLVTRKDLHSLRRRYGS